MGGCPLQAPVIPSQGLPLVSLLVFRTGRSAGSDAPRVGPELVKEELKVR